MKKNKCLIEQGFPCHQVGAETQRERDTGKAPPVHRLHVWWARRPLTPSRAAILASFLPADTNPEQFIRNLGIEKVQAIVNGETWTLTGKLLERVVQSAKRKTADGKPVCSDAEVLFVDSLVIRALNKENEQRAENQRLTEMLKTKYPDISDNPLLLSWETENRPLPQPWPNLDDMLPVQRVMGDPARAKALMGFAKKYQIHFPGNLYGYDRAFQKLAAPLQSAPPSSSAAGLTVLDPTSGGGSIPFEALRLGCNVIANDLNPVAAIILHSTLDYPARFGVKLAEQIELWGKKLLARLDEELSIFFPDVAPIPAREKKSLEKHLDKIPESVLQFDQENVTAYLFARQVICPHCGGEAPLLNTCWVSKKPGDAWGIRIAPDGKSKNGKAYFETYQMCEGKGPDGEDPDFATVRRGVGICIHCRQAVSGDEIKTQARGESSHGRWQDRLYCVVASRFEPELDKHGMPRRFKSGIRKGKVRTRKIRFFRPPNDTDLKALEDAEKALAERWENWKSRGWIPTEKIPFGQKTSEPLRYGMSRWCDMFTPRQLLGHLTLIEGLNDLSPRILEQLGPEKGRAVVTYLQYAIDKGLDYNSRQTRWIPQRTSVSGTFGRHDFSLKWTFGETIFIGPSSGAAWGLSQVTDAYKGIASLLSSAHSQIKKGEESRIRIYNGPATHIPQISDHSVDLVCMDPPYYDNVQYAELSDYFYVWQKRTLKDLYPEIFSRRLTNKKEEAVANSVRDGSAKEAKQAYQRMMGGIFAECSRVLRADGLFNLMFTHKSQDAWETLTRSLIESNWIITATVPVESEFAASIHQKHKAAAASSIFISCRKREQNQGFPAVWTGIGGSGVQRQIQDAVEAGLKEFEPLHLNPVDQMVACYGRALRVFSEQWPVMDGDDSVNPVRAMNEASRVVSAYQIRRITANRLTVDDLDSESAMALTFFGIWGLGEFSFDEALNLSKSLNISILSKNAGYRVEGRMMGMNKQISGNRSLGAAEETAGFHAPLIRKGSKLRLARPEERNPDRLSNPQTGWDILQGLIREYRKGDIPLARPYLEKHIPDNRHVVLDLLRIWGAEAGHPDLKKEAENILFYFNSIVERGMRPSKASDV